MKPFAWLVGLAGLAGCGITERPTYVEPEPAPIEAIAPPPERFLRLPVNYTFFEPADRKEYSIRTYKDAELDDTTVTVREPGQRERKATPAETDFALGRYRHDWLEASPADQRSLAQRRVGAELKRRATLIDDQILLTEASIGGYQENLADAKAEYSSTQAYGTKERPEYVQLLKARIGEIQVRLIGAQARLALLQQRRRARDGAAEAEPLDDLLDGK